MLTTIRKMGNSQGVLIPKPLLQQVGLADEVGHRQFNPPSLRGVGRREPLLHDGRAATLDEVFRRYRHPREATLSDAEVDDLVAYLKTL